MLVSNPRHEALQPLSKEHHTVLLVCNHIEEGLKKTIENQRIKDYSDWFKSSFIDPHFELEKQYVFPILGMQNVRIKRALANHRRLDRLFNETSNLTRVLHRIEEELRTYIHFEERILYNEIQSIASQDQLKQIEDLHEQLSFCDSCWDDRFWL